MDFRDTTSGTDDRSLGEMAKDVLLNAVDKAKELALIVNEMVTSEWEAAEVVEGQMAPDDKDYPQILGDETEMSEEERMRRLADVKHLREQSADIDLTMEAKDELAEIERRDRFQEPPVIGGEKQFAEEKVPDSKKKRA